MVERKNSIWFIESSKFKKTVEESRSLSDALINLNLKKTGANFTVLKRRIKEDNIDINKMYTSHRIGGTKSKSSIIFKINKDELENIIKNSKNYEEVFDKLGMKDNQRARNKLKERIRKDCIDAIHIFNYNTRQRRWSLVWSLSKEDFADLIKESKSFADVLRKLGLREVGGVRKTLNKRICEEGVDVTHIYDNFKNSNNGGGFKIGLEDILVENSNYNSTSNLKQRLLKENLIKNECNICGQKPIWNEKILVMVLDHINGNCKDNRIENLRLICPNCNSQTDTFAGRNNKWVKERKKMFKEAKIKQKEYICSGCGKAINKNKNNMCIDCYSISLRTIERPSYEELVKMVEETNLSVVGRKYGVSSNAVKKWIKKYEKELNN